MEDTLLKTNNLKGGRLLNKGTYGCVVYPSIPCSKTKTQFSKTMKNNSHKKNTSHIKTVSKLIQMPDEYSNDEIKLSKILSNSDPHNQYFITIRDSCYIKNIPSKRSNTAYAKYDKHKDKFILSETKKLDKKYCKIDFRLKPLNLIMDYGGYNLHSIFKINTKNEKKLKIIQLIYSNFKSCFKTLLIGLKKMQDLRIVHSDIKLDNIMINMNSTNTSINMKYIDFGISLHLTPKYCEYETNNDNNFRKLYVLGTDGYISPDVIIVNNLHDVNLNS